MGTSGVMGIRLDQISGSYKYLVAFPFISMTVFSQVLELIPPLEVHNFLTAYDKFLELERLGLFLELSPFCYVQLRQFVYA